MNQGDLNWGNLPRRFLHAISLGDPADILEVSWLACWNLALDGRLRSPAVMGALHPGLQLADLREIAIDDLHTDPPPYGAGTPRAMHLIGVAALLRGNQTVVNGLGKPVELGLDRKLIIKLSDAELEFERVRRLKAPEASSRLTSLYLAENNSRGRRFITQMFGGWHLLLRVTIPSAIRITKADAGFFEAYIATQDFSLIERYWSGEECSQEPSWEYLVEGVIEIDDAGDYATVRAEAERVALARGWSVNDLPSLNPVTERKRAKRRKAST